MNYLIEVYDYLTEILRDYWNIVENDIFNEIRKFNKSTYILLSVQYFILITEKYDKHIFHSKSMRLAVLQDLKFMMNFIIKNNLILWSY
jgi:hypothetical protein